MFVDFSAMAAGAVAGFAVDVSLFPLDTLKTRMQSSQGFWKAGGFKNIYRGLGSAAVGSMPGAALFFCTYESTKPMLGEVVGKDNPAAHMLAGAMGEVVACGVRVPTENVKQKLQAGLYKTTTEALNGIVSTQGYRGFFTGYFTTVMREVPFSMIQFPIWEAAKAHIKLMKGEGGEVHSWESAAAGSFSGAVAAALTTPLDVVKTRLMLGADSKGVPYTSMSSTFQRVASEEGVATLFSGVGPRVMWIGIGGFVFFGAYEKSRSIFLGATNE
mmetsp:Transcript_7596/g.12286  ORF Transcript_7596/g.12286 Transcript_7596/m.12286 type:complete len:272 (-) Transcript_7596:1707-2522(-)